MYTKPLDNENLPPTNTKLIVSGGYIGASCTPTGYGGVYATFHGTDRGYAILEGRTSDRYFIPLDGSRRWVEDCDCSEDYGPCENHSLALVIREGASHRSADQLNRLFIDDATDLGAELSRTAVLDLASIDDPDRWDGSWLADESDRDLLIHYRDQVESDLYTVDFPDHPRASVWVQWEDGYVISLIIGGPLDDTEPWRHDAQRDGSGCVECGAWAMVNTDNVCRQCWEGASND